MYPEHRNYRAYVHGLLFLLQLTLNFVNLDNRAPRKAPKDILLPLRHRNYI